MDTNSIDLKTRHSTVREQLQDNSNSFRQDGKPKEDMTGRGRLVSNVIYNWATHFVFIVAGFILPRMIDRRLGQDLLGVWDFAWSLLVYMDFLAVGLSSSVGRYVSRFKSVENWDELNRIVNSSLVLLIVSFFAGSGLAIGLAQFVPHIFQSDDESLVSQAQLVLVILGTACALQLLTLAFKSVITGSGRFDIESAILGGSRVFEVGTMVFVLVKGYGLIGLATVVLGFECLRMLGSVIGAKYVCPQLSISFRRCSLAAMGRLLRFGGKSLLFTISRMGMYQFNSILVAHFLGPGMLAVFSRQRSLVLHCESVMIHYARTLLPVASALHAKNDREGIRDLLTKGSLYSWYIALPSMIVLIVMGGPLVRLWMGTTYELPVVLVTLAVGHLLIISQRGTLDVIMAFNRHGLVGIGMLMSSVVSVLMGWFLLGPMKMGLVGPAVALAIPVTFFGLGTMIVGCHITGVSVREYLRRTLPGPVRLMIPFTAWLILARLACGKNTSIALIAGLIPATIMLLCMYWYFVLPHSLKDRMTESLFGIFKKKIYCNV